jgi:hypothetical protein
MKTRELNHELGLEFCRLRDSHLNEARMIDVPVRVANGAQNNRQALETA